MAKSIKEFRAKWDGTCVKCGGKIHGYKQSDNGTGDEISWIRVPNGKALTYHKACAHLETKAEFLPNGNGIPQQQGTEQSEPEVQEIETQETEQIKPEPAPNSDNFLAGMANAIAPYLESKLKTKPDISQVASLIESKVKDALENHTRTLVIKKEETGEVKQVGMAHKQFDDLLKLVQRRMHVYLWGGAGGGKSYAAKQVADALDLPFGYIALTLQTSESKLFGHMTPDGKYVETEFFRCYTNGGVFCIDEGDNAHGNLQTALNGALENGHCAFPCGVKPRHADFVMVMTGNTPGNGANATYNSRNPMDGAFRERFAFVEWTYDETLEMGAATAINPKAKKWVEWVRGVRGTVKNLNVKLIVSPRVSIKGAELLETFSTDFIAEAVLFKGIDRDTKTKVLTANPLPRIS